MLTKCSIRELLIELWSELPSAARAGLDPNFYVDIPACWPGNAGTMNHVEERDIAKQTGHPSMMTLRKYIRDGEHFRNNASGWLGL